MGRDQLWRAREAVDIVRTALIGTQSARSRWCTLDARQRVGVLLHGCAALALVLVCLALGVDSGSVSPVVVAELVGIVVIARLAEVVLASTTRLDAGLAIDLIALVLMGPVVAVALAVAQVLIQGLIDREPLVRTGNLANVAAYGWDVFAGAAVLALAGVHGLSLSAMPALITAGAAMIVVNALGPMTHQPLHRRVPARQMFAQLVAILPAAVVMVLLGAATAVLYASIGPLALAVFGVIVIVPETLVRAAARTRSVADLDPSAATRAYAEAIAHAMGLRRHERRVVDATAQLAPDSPWGVLPSRWRHYRPAEAADIGFALRHCDERWDGTGQPTALEGPMIPLGARVVMVAAAWAGLTTGTGARLTQEHALLDLRARAETDFDPAVVEAAGRIAAEFADPDDGHPALPCWPTGHRARAAVLARVPPAARVGASLAG